VPYLIILIVALIVFYRSVKKDSKITYFLFRFSGIITIASFSYFLYDVGAAFDNGAKRISTLSLIFSLFTFILWQGKVSMRILNNDQSSRALRIIVRIFSIGTMFPFSILSKKMYQKFDVEKRAI
tara:strand:+ start:399 stop:773 length:375 start_codon:yes stop_codon:yes gene_type:complete